VLQLGAPAVRKGTGGLHSLIPQIPSCARIQTQPAVARGHIGPLDQGLFDNVVHGSIVHRLFGWLYETRIRADLTWGRMHSILLFNDWITT
jgi:hypothetical protein